MAKPTTLPKFADEDLVDGTSGENNVIEPDNDPHQRFGWGFKEQPPRNFINWIHRWTYRWIQWLNTVATEGTLAVDVLDSVGTIGTATLHWRKFRKHVFIRLFATAPYKWAVAGGGSSLKIYPTTGDWGVLYSSILQNVAVPIINENEEYAGALHISDVITTPWEFASPVPPSGVGFPNYRLGSGVFFGSCGFPTAGINFSYLSFPD